MNCAFRWRVLVFAVSSWDRLRFGHSRSGSERAGADLASRIDSLEKQLADLKSQMEAQKAARQRPARPPRPRSPRRAPAADSAPPDSPVCWDQPR